MENTCKGRCSRAVAVELWCTELVYEGTGTRFGLVSRPRHIFELWLFFQNKITCLTVSGKAFA